MKKKILFVMNNLNVGGAEKALVSMLQVFDFSRYEVDLLLFKQEGLFLKQLPADVNLLPEPENWKYFDMPFSQVVKENFFRRKWNVIIQRILFKVAQLKPKKAPEMEQFGWKSRAKTITPLSKKYDVAIGFLQNNPNYFVVDKVNAKKKIGYIHNDYELLGLNKEFDLSYFKVLDSIITISESCLDVLNKQFPNFQNKLFYIPNIVSEKLIRKLAGDGNPYVEPQIKILSIGRLEPQKAFHRAIEAAQILVNKGYDIRWDILGEGNQRRFLENKIKDYHLENVLLLQGLEPNPYKFLKNCDFFVQPSDFEGKSIAVDEAKILQKVIILTNYPTAKDQIRHLQNGYISEKNGEAVANAIIELIKNKHLQGKFVANLAQENWGTEKEIEKIYQLIES